VVREGEEVPEKDWFSRRKSPASGVPTSHLSPVAVSPVAPEQTQKPNPQVGDDADLPPRECRTPIASTSALPTSGPEQGPSDVDGDVASELPARAGFDLTAMRAVIEGVDEGKESQRDGRGFAQPEISPPLQRAATSAELTPTGGHPSGIPSRATDGFGDFAAAKALSLNNTRSAPLFDSKKDGHDDHVADDMDGDLRPRSPPLSTLPSHSLPAAGPTLSFTSDDRMPWSPVAPDKDVLGGFGTPFGNPFRPTSFAAVGSGVPPPNISSANLATTTLATDRDPWSFRSDVSASTTGKQPSVFAANPWEG
jgi:hypothetical protein